MGKTDLFGMDGITNILHGRFEIQFDRTLIQFYNWATNFPITHYQVLGFLFQTVLDYNLCKV
jgi:hypothetical protein